MATPHDDTAKRHDLLGTGARRRVDLPDAQFTPRRSIATRSVDEALLVDAEPEAPPSATEPPPPDNVTPLRQHDARQLAARERNEKADAPEFERRQREIAILDNALGPLQKLLKKPTVSDILRNPDGKIFVIEVGQPKYEISDFVMTEEQAFALIGAVSTYAKKEVDERRPFLEAILPHDGSRFTALLPPSVFPGCAIAIRKHSILSRTLDDYLDQGAIDNRQLVQLRRSIAKHDNILIVGSTGSGKTTFANAMLREMAQNAPERIIIAEDTPELQCPADDVVKMQTTPDLTMNDLLHKVLRLSPNRICIGEIRGAEAHALIKFWNTGHKGGLTTIHSESAARGLVRLEECIEEANVPAHKSRIAAAIQLIVVINCTETGKRRVTEIKRLLGADDREYRFES